jgi:hypothetical protein
MEVEVNYLGVLLAMLSSMVVGSIWYARPVFGNLWIKLAKVDMDRKGAGAWLPMVLALVVSLVTAYVLAHVAYLSHTFFQNSFLHDSLTTAFWLWLGFTAARIITHDSFEGRPLKLTALTLGNEFVTIMLMGLVIGLVGV